MEKIKLRCISIAKDGGSKQYIPADSTEPQTMEEARIVIDNAYYLDGAIGSPTRGKLFSKHPKNGGVELDKDNYEFDR